MYGNIWNQKTSINLFQFEISSHDLKVMLIPDIFLLFYFLSLNERIFETSGKKIYFTSKALFVLEIFKFRILKS